MKQDYQQKQPNNERDIAKKLELAGKNRLSVSSRRLDDESRSRKYTSSVKQHPLASRERYSGNVEEGLTHVVVIGDTMLGVSRNFNRKKVGGETSSDPIESIRVLVLPIGNPGLENRHSSVTLAEVKPAALKRPRENGVVQSWEDVAIGRSVLTQATGFEDVGVSRDHMIIRIDSDGSVTFMDHSTNGSQVFDEKDFNSMPVGQGLDPSGQDELGSLMQKLQENTTLWDEDSAGKTIINPYV